MSLGAFLQALQHTRIALAIAGDAWYFPNIETLHVLSIATVFGSVLLVDLRLLGVGSRAQRVTRLAGELLPYTWAAFGIAVITGTLMFVSKAPVYFHNLQFRLKFLFMGLAGVNMLAFHLGIYRRVAVWDTQLPPPRAARLAGALSIGLWLAVFSLGRWIGFTT